MICSKRSGGLLARLGLGHLLGNRARAGTRMGVDFLRIERLAALGAHQYWIEVLPAFTMFVQQRSSALVDHVRVAPMHQRHHDRIQVESLLGKDVFVPLGRLLVGDATQYALSD